MLTCYLWRSSMTSVDSDTVALYVQRAGGHFSVRGDTVVFWVPESAETMLLCAWPDLQRLEDQDLI